MPKKLYSGSSDQKELKNIANKKLKDSKLQELTATLVVEGNPGITADCIIELDGVAGIHSGKWYVEKVTHSISKSGYTTSIELKKNATNQPAKASSTDASASQKQAQEQEKQNFGGQKTVNESQTVQVQADSGLATKKIQSYDADGNPI